MSLPIYQRVAVTDAGDIIPGAEYTVINENTGVAQPIYSDRTGTSLKSAPYFADSVGTIQFYIAQGTTFRVAASGGVGTYTDRYVYAAHPQSSPTDTTAGSLMAVGAFGLGTNHLPYVGDGYADPDEYVTTGTYYGGFINTPVSSGTAYLTVVGGSSNGGRASQSWRLAVTASTIYNRWQTSPGVWSAWDKTYSTANLNTNQFGSGANKYVALGYAQSATSARFFLPISFYSTPSSVTVSGTFFALLGGSSMGNPVITGLASASNKMAVIEAINLNGLTAGQAVSLYATSSNAKITVNA
jgi:hypothetical protein